MITSDNVITSSGRYPDRANSKELTEQVKENILVLVNKVNQLLTELKITASISITSGFRTSEANGATSNAAKKSLHMQGFAVDILDDKEQTLGHIILKHPEVLKKYGLFIEDLGSTKGKFTNWVHLDCSPTRADRPSRSFLP